MNAASMSFAVRMLIGFSFVLVLLISVRSASATSTIQGFVYDQQRNALSDIEVELLNDYHQMQSRTRTDGAGRYQFVGLRDGRYSVRVYAFRYDLEDQTLPVEVLTQSIRGGEGTGYFPLDFYLAPKRGGLADTELGVVFAQDVPAEAKKVYEQSVRDLAKKRLDEGIAGLNESLRLFPKYYLALHSMGKELFIQKRYKEAVPFFINAIEVNPKSATSLYYLGSSLHYMGAEYNKAAITTLNQAAVLAPASVQVMYILGKVERSSGKYADAEKHLLEAKKLSRVGIPEIHRELAQLYGNDLKKYKEAADELEAYLKTSKASGEETKTIKKKIGEMREKAKIAPAKS